MINIIWGRKMANWDCAEVETRYGTVCPVVADIPGPDDRAMFSIDVPDPERDGKIRSLASGFADNLEEARIAAANAIAKLDQGLSIA
ncbi:hypothetical protein QWE_11406 [Agrobacterium albertimagni AOL15]|uniref:Uncharacterized protein n=1 Tax=Agrobacterium albertimagni AOL15 TaxID=1156935 RepID=K2QVX1_9HYPH|nr:hypothetical protein [Agrobacterium albertimagni]EKF59402.1 hypothetical protein QWE_11406 [Agrobacterium albertimagni AOL15]